MRRASRTVCFVTYTQANSDTEICMYSKTQYIYIYYKNNKDCVYTVLQLRIKPTVCSCTDVTRCSSAVAWRCESACVWRALR